MDEDLRERLSDLAEEARVRWFMLDPQVKQAIVLGTVYFLFTLLDIGGTLVKVKASKGGGGAG